jgi:hypothetical protein
LNLNIFFNIAQPVLFVETFEEAHPPESEANVKTGIREIFVED